MRYPEIHHDEEVGCSYVKIGTGDCLRTYPTEYKNVTILIDIDKEGNLLGIEIVQNNLEEN